MNKRRTWVARSWVYMTAAHGLLLRHPGTLRQIEMIAVLTGISFVNFARYVDARQDRLSSAEPK